LGYLNDGIAAMKEMKTILVRFGWLFLAASAFAGSRSSASYSVPADVADAGGNRAISANYSNDGSAGGIGGISAAVPTIAKHGYIGQLYDLAGLSLSATPVTINELGTRQIGAVAVADDTTVSPLNPGTLVWGVVSGPISSVSPAGLATAGIVYQTTAAVVFGRRGSLSNTLGLSVLNVGIDDYLSYAGDGVNDAWQVQYFGEENSAALGSRDPDGDGQSNYFEYYVDTQPTNAASKFNLSIANVAAQPTRKDIIFSPRWPTRVYDVQYRDDLVLSGWGALTGSTTNDAAQVRTVRDLNATGSQKHYRVRISIP